MNLFDASALLSFLAAEDGADIVEEQLVKGGACSAANWSETAQKLLSRGKDWELSRRLLLSYGLVIEPVYASDAEQAARLWRRGSGLSLADRLCLATAETTGCLGLDGRYCMGAAGRIRQIR